MKLTIEKQIAIGFGIVIVLIVVLSTVVFLNARTFIENSVLAQHTLEVIDTLDKTFTTIEHVETGIHGYVISNDEKFLKPYQTALSSVDGYLERLRELTVDNPSQRNRVALLDQAATQVLDWATQALQAYQAEGFEGAHFIVTEEGKQKMDAFRSVITEIRAEESTLMDQTHTAIESSANITKNLLLTTVIVILGTIMTMAILLRNNLRARELAEEKVREINLNLEKLVAKRTTKLKESMGREHGLLKAIPDAVIQMNRDGFLSDYHAPHPNILPTRITKGCNIREAFAPEVSELFLRHAQSALETRATETFEVKLKGAEGLNFYEVRMAPSSPEEVVAIARDITERKRAEEQLRLQSAALEASANAIVITDREGIIQWVNPAFTALSGYSAEEAVGKKPNILKSGVHDQAFYKDLWDTILAGRVWRGEITNRRKDSSLYIVEHNITPIQNTRGEITHFVTVQVDITERKRAEEQIQEQLQTLSALYAGAQRLTESLDLEEVAKQVTRTCVEVFKVRLAWLGRANPDGSVKPLSWFPEETAYLREISVRWDDTPEGQGPTGRAIRSGFPQIIEDISGDPRFAPWRETALQAGLSTSAAFPLISRGETFGALNLFSDQPGFFSPERLEMFQAFAHQAAAALENTRLFEETHRRLAHITALRNIDMAITGSLDLRVTFNVALDEIVNQLKIDAASILRLDPYTQTLEYAAGRGFRTRAIEQSRLRLGEGHAGRAALERRIVHIPNLLETGRDFLRADLLKGEGFMTYFAAPLIAKGRVLGVLEIFHRSPLEGNDEWLNFLETLAGQTAIAIDNTRLFYDLERANVSLLQAYDATIEGWSRALDLRDKETEGHTQRVTELTLRLAREMGISDEELIHLRRGALLHDIGKMGIPDHILLKPGPLTEEEWEIMRKHPQYAYEMLSPIEYLRPALDIPYCHHEKWDGTGYPRGLKGEQIPLAARIFAVVDVWDALTSDRPYRGAWPKEKALEYIREQSGKHFDPKVVELFLEIANQIQDT